MSKERAFPLCDVLSVAVNKILSPKGMRGVQALLSYMTGESLHHLQLARAAAVCQPHLLKQHPQLSDINVSNLTLDKWPDWHAKQVKRFGETLLVRPLEPGQYEPRDPVEEAEELVGRDRVLVIAPEQGRKRTNN